MELGMLFNEVERARREILQGRVSEGVSSLYRLRKSGYPVSMAEIEDIVHVPGFLEHLYDETQMGDAVHATRCLAAVKGLDGPVDNRKIDYVRFKKISMTGMGIAEHAKQTRPAFNALIVALQTFHVMVGDFQECAVRRGDRNVAFEEEVMVRFPNASFRDAFLRVAGERARESQIQLEWAPRSGGVSPSMTGRIRWRFAVDGPDLPPDWPRTVKQRFDAFLNSLPRQLDELDFMRFKALSKLPEELSWVVFSRNPVISGWVCSALNGLEVVPISDTGVIESFLFDSNLDVGAFIFHVSLRDMDVIQAMAESKIRSKTTAPPFIVLAEDPFFQVLKDPHLLFPGCERLLLLSQENVRAMEKIVPKILHTRRHFIRLSANVQCHASLSGSVEHTRATPVSPAGALIRTHRIAPLFSPAEVEMSDRDSGFSATLEGRIIYNQPDGSAIRFSSVIPPDHFVKLREITLQKFYRMVDTFQRSVL